MAGNGKEKEQHNATVPWSRGKKKKEGHNNVLHEVPAEYSVYFNPNAKPKKTPVMNHFAEHEQPGGLATRH